MTKYGTSLWKDIFGNKDFISLSLNNAYGVYWLSHMLPYHTVVIINKQASNLKDFHVKKTKLFW